MSVDDAPEPPLPSAAALAALARSLKQQAAAVAALSKALDPPAPDKLSKPLDKLAPATGAPSTAAIVDGVAVWLAWERAGRRQRLSDQLRALSAERGLTLAVLTRDPLEVRLAPVSACVDVDADETRITFGREVVTTCGARAEAILDARDRALAVLEAGPWDAAAFHGQLRAAWQRLGRDDWAELSDVLPELAMVRQGKRFRADPTARNFEPYPRVRLAYDLWRLRRDRCLMVDGWRLSLGPATGGSTRDKKRVFYLEDADGNGQYHLTLRFVREAPHG